MKITTLLLTLAAASGLRIAEIQAAEIQVQNANDAGDGSLRKAISDAQAGDTITFNGSLAGQAIVLTSGELPINKSLTIQGLGANRLAINGNAASRIFHISGLTADATVNFSGLLITNGRTFGDALNTAGGGIWFEGSGTINFNNCEIAGNHSYWGGGLFVHGTTASTFLTLTDCTIVGNESRLANGGGAALRCTAKLVNCTISDNVTRFVGAGIALYDDGNLDLENCTITRNKPSQNGVAGGGISAENGEVKLRNTIVAENQPAPSEVPAFIPTLFPDIAAAVTSFGHNLIGVDDPGNSGQFSAIGDQVGTTSSPLDPRLGPLQDNGGPTRTHALLLGSPAIDAADSLTFAATDQRGVVRPQDTKADIGAFELQKNIPQIACQEQPSVFGCVSAGGTLLTENVLVTDPDLGQTLIVKLTEGDLVLATQTITTPVDNQLITFDSVPLLTGVHPLTIAVSDGYSDASCASSVTLNPDLTGPAISGAVHGTGGWILPNINSTASSTAGVVVSYPAVTATDNCTASDLIQVTYSKGSGTLFPVGSTTVTCTATDAAGNQTEVSFTVTVAYSWSDALQPINADGSSVFKAGSTVPVKFNLTGASAGITGLVAKLSYVKLGDTVIGAVNEAVSTSAATSGNLFRFDGGGYIYNWSTKGLSAGRYALQIDLGDGVIHSVSLALK